MRHTVFHRVVCPKFGHPVQSWWFTLQVEILIFIREKWFFKTFVGLLVFTEFDLRKGFLPPPPSGIAGRVRLRTLILCLIHTKNNLVNIDRLQNTVLAYITIRSADGIGVQKVESHLMAKCSNYLLLVPTNKNRVYSIDPLLF